MRDEQAERLIAAVRGVQSEIGWGIIIFMLGVAMLTCVGGKP